ncbi:MAG: TetR/AcrR family transcriptional regulator [Streptosporangiaceae bacterium]
MVAELADAGFGRLTMEGVAERAGCGKMPLYRRWSSTSELVLDALTHTLPTTPDPPDTGSLREDLLAVLTRMTENTTTTPVGAALGTSSARAAATPTSSRSSATGSSNPASRYPTSCAAPPPAERSTPTR